MLVTADDCRYNIYLLQLSCNRASTDLELTVIALWSSYMMTYLENCYTFDLINVKNKLLWTKNRCLEPVGSNCEPENIQAPDVNLKNVLHNDDYN